MVNKPGTKYNSNVSSVGIARFFEPSCKKSLTPPLYFHYACDHSDRFFTDRNECRKLLTESNILAPAKIIIQTESPYQMSR